MVSVDVAKPKNERQQSVNKSSTERQQSVKDFVCRIVYNPRAVIRHVFMIKGLVAFTGNKPSVIVADPKNDHQQSVNRASTERQQSVNRASTECQPSINRASTECPQSVYRESTMLGVACCIIRGLYYDIYK